MAVRAGLVLVGVLATNAFADPPPPAIDDAIKQAAAAKQPLVIEFGAAWCGPCKQFEADVLPAPDVQLALKSVTFVRYDVDVSPGSEAAARYAIEAYPTFLVVDRRGGEATRRRGGLDAPSFIELVQSAKSAALDETDIQAELRAHPNDPAAHLNAARWFAKQHQTADAIAHYSAVLKAKTVAAGDRDEAQRACEHLKRFDVWHHDLVADKAAAAKASPLTIAVDDVTIATVDSTLPAKDVKALLATVLGAQTDAARANALIYVALAAGANDEALATAKRLLAQSTQAQFLDTLAECFHATGDRDQALATEDEALKAAGGGGNGLAELIKRNRARFDSGKGDSTEVAQLHARVVETWKRLEAADQLAQTPAPPVITGPAPSQRYANMKKTFDAIQALGKAIGQKCAGDAGKAKLAIANVRVDPLGNIAATNSLLLDDNATPKLRTCISKLLSAATLVPEAVGQQMIRIDLKP